VRLSLFGAARVSKNVFGIRRRYDLPVRAAG
jgi:hypothetical protein